MRYAVYLMKNLNTSFVFRTPARHGRVVAQSNILTKSVYFFFFKLLIMDCSEYLNINVLQENKLVKLHTETSTFYHDTNNCIETI
jgi:hypothetical protein